MSDAPRNDWRPFWILFGLGWALFAFLVATNGQMVTDASPRGILDHQVAGSAARIDEIQRAWADSGKLDFARLSMGVDLVFIGVLSVAGVVGGVRIAGAAKGPILRRFGWLTTLPFLVFGATDYAETLSQFVQVMSQGSDVLAQVAAAVNQTKVVSFLAGNTALIAGLIGLRLTTA